MRRFFCIALFIGSVLHLKAGCYAYAIIRINGLSFFDSQVSSFHARWINNCYANSLDGGPYGLNVTIYFQPGDTIYLDNIIVTQPGVYTTSFDENCENVFEWNFTNHFTCSYLSGILETYYRYNLDHHFLDSLGAVQKAIDDSIASAKRDFNDSVAAVPAIVYPNPIAEVLNFECFKTVQQPFDLELFDLEGRRALFRHVTFTDSYQIQSIDVSGLEAGPYIANYFINGRQYRRQIVKL